MRNPLLQAPREPSSAKNYRNNGHLGNAPAVTDLRKSRARRGLPPLRKSEVKDRRQTARTMTEWLRRRCNRAVRREATYGLTPEIPENI